MVEVLLAMISNVLYRALIHPWLYIIYAIGLICIIPYFTNKLLYRKGRNAEIGEYVPPSE